MTVEVLVPEYRSFSRTLNRHSEPQARNPEAFMHRAHISFSGSSPETPRTPQSHAGMTFVEHPTTERDRVGTGG